MSYGLVSWPSFVVWPAAHLSLLARSQPGLARTCSMFWVTTGSFGANSLSGHRGSQACHLSTRRQTRRSSDALCEVIFDGHYNWRYSVAILTVHWRRRTVERSVDERFTADLILLRAVEGHQQRRHSTLLFSGDIRTCQRESPPDRTSIRGPRQHFYDSEVETWRQNLLPLSLSRRSAVLAVVVVERPAAVTVVTSLLLVFVLLAINIFPFPVFL